MATTRATAPAPRSGSSRRVPRRATLAVAGLLALAGTTVAVAPSASAGDTGARITAWVACDGPQLLLTVQPVDHLISCADANSGLSRMTWSAWADDEARGRGVYRWNDCVPSCAAGTEHRSPATIVLDRVRVQAGEPVFTRATIRYVDDAGVAQVERVRSIRWTG